MRLPGLQDQRHFLLATKLPKKPHTKSRFHGIRFHCPQASKMLGHTTEPFYSSQPLPQWDGGGDKMTKECPILLNYQELLRSIQVTLPSPLTSIQGIEPHKRWRTGRGRGALSPQHDPWEGVKQRGGRTVNTAVPQKQPGRATVPSKAGLLWHLKTTQT